ncbi:hypothetical protein M7784_14940 [Desulfovibrio aminophilus]|nr:hypothetical protein [Desulfovibrio aminophilus]MCM0756530.1 hypothetical protein [Desulfovibrio aminophilus]
MKKLLAGAALMALLLMTSQAHAHSALCDCFDNGDGTITCQGGFSDGSSAAGVKMSVLDGSGKAILDGKMNKDSEFTFKKPAAPYKVKFDAGEGHSVEIDGAKIVQ